MTELNALSVFMYIVSVTSLGTTICTSGKCLVNDEYTIRAMQIGIKNGGN